MAKITLTFSDAPDGSGMVDFHVESDTPINQLVYGVNLTGAQQYAMIALDAIQREAFDND